MHRNPKLDAKSFMLLFLLIFLPAPTVDSQHLAARVNETLRNSLC